MDHPLPPEYIKTLAIAQGVSQGELEALQLAVSGYSTVEVAQQLELSAIAVRKRLGEVYRKFNIKGKGPGKLAQLKHQLILEFQSTVTVPTYHSKPYPASKIDWEHAPDLGESLGRTWELEQLQQWIISDRSHLVAILGVTRIGKTALTIKLIQQIHPDFDLVIWRCLRYAPPFDRILTDLIQTISGSQTCVETGVNGIFQLIECFRKRRCLIVFDEIENLFQKGELAGTYRDNCQEYGELFRQVSELEHSSCLIVLSQEEPLEISRQAGINQPVKVLPLSGLLEEDGKQLIYGILPNSISQEQKIIQLVQSCDGHPLLLRLVAQKVQELFNDNLEDFFEYNQVLFGNFDDLAWLGRHLNLVFYDQFERLSADEYQVLNGLALLSKNPSVEELQSQIKSISDPSKFLTIWASLERRCFVQKTSESGKSKNTLNPLVKQYIKQKVRTKIHELFADNQDYSQQESTILQAFGLQNIEIKSYNNNGFEPREKAGRFLNQIGYEQYMKGEFFSAKLSLTWAIELHPNLASAHFNLGATYEKLQDIDSAQIHYERAIEFSLRVQYSAINNLARLQIKKGNYQTAIELIEPILSRVEQPMVLASLYKNLGWAYYQKNLYSQAEIMLLKALDLDHQSVAAYYLLAQVKSAQGNKKEALKYWQEGLNCSVGKAGLSEPWKWPEIEHWELEARRQLQIESNS